MSRKRARPSSSVQAAGRSVFVSNPTRPFRSHSPPPGLNCCSSTLRQRPSRDQGPAWPRPRRPSATKTREVGIATVSMAAATRHRSISLLFYTAARHRDVVRVQALAARGASRRPLHAYRGNTCQSDSSPPPPTPGAIPCSPHLLFSRSTLSRPHAWPQWRITRRPRRRSALTRLAVAAAGAAAVVAVAVTTGLQPRQRRLLQPLSQPPLGLCRQLRREGASLGGACRWAHARPPLRRPPTIARG